MGGVAYVGSCPAEDYLRMVYGTRKPPFRAFRVNKASFMDDRPWRWPEVDGLNPELQRRLRYEGQKGFIDGLRKAAPDELVLDFLGEVRMPIIVRDGQVISYSYELQLEEAGVKERLLDGCEVLEFGTPSYWRIVMNSVAAFCDLLNGHLPDTRVVVHMCPSVSENLSRRLAEEDFLGEACFWGLREEAHRDLSLFAAGRLKNVSLFLPATKLVTDDTAFYGAGVHHYSDRSWELIMQDLPAHHLPLQDYHERSCAARREKSYFPAKFDAFVRSLGRRPDMEPDTLIRHLPLLYRIMTPKEFDILDDPAGELDVISAFKWLLGRAPESADVIYSHAEGFESQRHLRAHMLASQEFRNELRALGVLTGRGEPFVSTGVD